MKRVLSNACINPQSLRWLRMLLHTSAAMYIANELLKLVVIPRSRVGEHFEDSENFCHLLAYRLFCDSKGVRTHCTEEGLNESYWPRGESPLGIERSARTLSLLITMLDHSFYDIA